MIKKDALWGNINVDQIPNNIEIKIYPLNQMIFK